MKIIILITIGLCCSSSLLLAQRDLSPEETFDPTDITFAQQEPVKLEMVHPPETSSLGTTINRGTIGPGDTVTISSLNCEEISKSWRVGSSGDVSLPMVGRIHVAGKTADQLEKELVLRLQKFIREPQVTVNISDFQSQPIMVTGGVEKPGSFQREEGETVLHALIAAGGPKGVLGKVMHGPTATLTRNLKYGPVPLPNARNDPSRKFSIAEFSLKDAMNGSTVVANLALQPEDVINVSAKPPFVYVVGEVNRPGAVELATQDHTSLVQLLAVAGGVTRDASPRKTEILSLGSDGLYVRKGSVDARKLLSGMSSDIKLIAGDVVVVPSSRLKYVWQSAVSTTLTTGSMILARF